MRHIKFRAWDKVNKIMIPQFGLWDIAEDESLNKWINGYGKVYVEDLELMQFTGLLDKNGKEIYDGDVIIGKRKEYDLQVDGWGRNLPHCPKCNPSRPPKDVSDIYTVEFDKGRFFLQRQPVSGKFEFNYNDTIEVIGNIYENPELLKQ